MLPRMSASSCNSCGKPKTILDCELCSESICKNCVQFLSEETFSFLPELPDALSHRNYCPQCYGHEVAPELDSYNEIMARAKDVFVFFKTQRKEIPLIRKEKITHRIEKCDDRDQTILRLAFLAAKQNFNGIIDVDVNAKKLRNGAYQTSEWSGTGVPALVDERKIQLQYDRDQVYR